MLLHTCISIFQTTYENFRYRADNRRNAFDRGCVPNFLEAFCSKIQPSKNKFRAFIQEEAPRIPMRHMPEVAEESGEDRRTKVEDDLEIGDDILKLSQRRDFYGTGDMKRRGSDGLIRDSADSDYNLGSEVQASLNQLGTQQSRRTASFGTSPHILAFNAIVSDNKKS